MAKRPKLRHIPSYSAATLVAALTVAAGTVLNLAINAASSSATWPGWLVYVQRHPFLALVILGFLAFLLPVVNSLWVRLGPEAAFTEDLADMEERLHDRFDAAAIAQARTDDQAVERLPPYARLLLRAHADQDDVWQLITPFVDDSLDPRAVAREWAAAVPAGVDRLSGNGLLIIAEILCAHSQPATAAQQFEAALRLGVSPRPFWHFRTAQVMWTVEGQQSASAVAHIRDAMSVDASYPLSTAAMLCVEERWQEAADAITGWNPTTPWEMDAAVSVLVWALLCQDRLDDAIIQLEAASGETHSAGLLLQLSELLRTRAVLGNGDSRWKDAFRAAELALRARNMRRRWRGDSAEAVAAAAHAAMIADDPQQVWSYTRPAPEGDATSAEAVDERVLPFAAIGAALTGRLAQARKLAGETPEGVVKRRIEAEIATVDPSIPRDRAIAAWHGVIASAPDDGLKLQALRALALEGAAEQHMIDELRERYPDAIAEIETIYKVMAVSGPDSDEILRQLEPSTPLASVRRAELLRENDDPLQAADVLVDATARWRDPRLLLLAIDSYMDAGAWERAESAAQQVLSEGGVLWQGRPTVLRRLVAIQTALENWPKVASACRALLEVDENDSDARWNLAFAEFRGGEIEQAWRTVKRLGAVKASTPTRAIFLLDLVRRFSKADEVAQAALAQLNAFPDNEEVHAAAINAVTMRVDRSDLPEEIGREVTEAWSAFFERYPQSRHFATFSIGEGENPLAEIEGELRKQATTYKDVLRMVRDNLLPLGLFERAVGKPYAAIFPYRPLGFHRIASPVPQDIENELEMARSAMTQECVVDASSLYTLALVPDIAPALLALVRRPAIAAAGLTDLLAADDYFSLPTAGTLGFDPDRGQIFLTEIDQDTQTRQQRQIRNMLSTARTLRRINHPAVVHVESLDTSREPAWLLNLDAAKGAGAVLWCDDLGLRRLAHAHGVKTFGTSSLLTVAAERGRLDSAELGNVTRTLMAEYVVDLPFDENILVAVAADQQWQPRAVATALSRAPSWFDVVPAVNLLRQALRNSASEHLVSWSYAALHGLKGASPPPSIQNNLSSLMTAVLCESWARPEHTKAFADAVRGLVPEEASGLLQTTLLDLWGNLNSRYAVGNASMIFLYLIGHLDEEYRQFAVKVLLQPTTSLDASIGQIGQAGLPGAYVQRWQSRLDEAASETDAVRLVAELLERAGAKTRVSADSGDFADLVVWEDSLTDVVGLPLVVEVISRWRSWGQIRARLERLVASSGSRTLLALTLDSRIAPTRWTHEGHTVLVAPATNLAAALARVPLGAAIQSLLARATSL